VRDVARDLRTWLAAGLDLVADALESGERTIARSALRTIDSIDERRLEDALALAREVARRAPRRRPLRKRLEALGASWLELDASVSDAHAVATGALRVLAERPVPRPLLAEAVRRAAAAVRAIEPDEARAAGEAARAAAERAADGESSLGAGVIAHGVTSVADHVLRAAAAREEERRLVEAQRRRADRLRVWRR
jgi:hypothetical protein